MLFKKINMLIAATALLFAACNSGQEQKTTTTEQSSFHKIAVKEVLQASEYTYLHASENNVDIWLAVPSMLAKAGETYYYEGGIKMDKFQSKELNRVFESIILLEKLNTEPKSSAIAASNKPYASTGDPGTTAAPSQDAQAGAPATNESYTRKAPVIEKKEVKIKPADGCVTIAKLYSDKETMAGKTVKIKGQVTKYTPAVMGKNWIHIQDGSDFNGKFDLAVTSENDVKVGDVVTLEGKIALNKDLGYGYFFDVIMEDAKLKQ